MCCTLEQQQLALAQSSAALTVGPDTHRPHAGGAPFKYSHSKGTSALQRICSPEAVRGSSNRGEGRTLFLISFVVQGYAYLSGAFSPCPLLPALPSPAYNPSHGHKADRSRERFNKASALRAPWLVRSHAGRRQLPTRPGDPTLHHHHPLHIPIK